MAAVKPTSTYDVAAGICESRPYVVLETNNRVGRTSVRFLCPFCGASVVAFVWSMAGAGRRCTCGVRFTRLEQGMAYKRRAGEKPAGPTKGSR